MLPEATASDDVGVSSHASAGYVPPPYPYDRLDKLKPLADHHDGGLVDLSIGTPVDPPTPAVLAALGGSDAERGYPPSIGTPELREAAAHWCDQRLGVQVDAVTEVAATIGSKEFVAGLPHWLHLRSPGRDTVLFPEISYPSYAMGAELAGCRAVPVPADEHWSIQLDAISESDAERALALWVNTPGNPAGGLDDLAAAARWGRERGVPVFSDECYAEFTWDGSPRTILSPTDAGNAAGRSLRAEPNGVVAVHSLSKRSNLAGVRVGFYAGDPELVHYLREIRKHAGFMVPGPAQAAAVAALADQTHVAEQRERYRSRLERLARIVGRFGPEPPLPRGGFYLWAAAPDGNAWAFTRTLLAEAGILVSPGEFYGAAAAGCVRIAAVLTEDALELVESRLN
ncbi:MAG: aminotransferase class I/II-fold pyridoxal phosphate-dependent enzyme [Acidimicrobiales bacterium]|nr:aminotransferase class I/II-fold pyridoxal phosphate-dependent enzyme [Acidimicrobiales bacterium]MYG87298.1 aminotransferase class I/II-fold pyridoxal phosphate-dependent enzyme [Acidimicrobiales bacterium]MYI28037.1 aminotransferase class I/II-fold pyridoxal phosphate-dependent enzyme [Acidimicrobiales bacterium]